LSDLRVLFIAAEAVPFVKVGGLGDFAGVLPYALRSLPDGKLGNPTLDIRLVLPLYPQIDRDLYSFEEISQLSIAHQNGQIEGTAYQVNFNGLIVYLIESPLISAANSIYSDDAGKDSQKFTFFSLAALELARRLDWQPHVIHANDWHTAIAVYANFLYRQHDPFFYHTRSLLTVHNLPYLGINAQHGLNEFGIPPAADSQLPWWARQLPLPLGLYSADLVNTVSPNYAKEILGESFGAGLNEFLKQRERQVIGILNGLDTSNWNPEADPLLPVTFSTSTLEKRDQNKRALQRSLGFPEDPTIPLIAMVGRLDPQKGVDLAVQALEKLANKNWQFVILGTGIHELHSLISDFQANHPDKVKVDFSYNEPLGHLIYGASDMLLIPSRYEPCGTSQMIAMHYGCVPIASAVGGLKDTVIDYDRDKDSTGFLIEPVLSEALFHRMNRAFEVYNDTRQWRALMRRGMRKDFTWTQSAKRYFDLYTSLAHMH